MHGVSTLGTTNTSKDYYQKNSNTVRLFKHYYNVHFNLATNNKENIARQDSIYPPLVTLKSLLSNLFYL